VYEQKGGELGFLPINQNQNQNKYQLIMINVLVYQSFDSNNTSEQVDDVAYPPVGQRRDVEV
jgi:hypothetical protein